MNAAHFDHVNLRIPTDRVDGVIRNRRFLIG